MSIGANLKIEMILTKGPELFIESEGGLTRFICVQFDRAAACLTCPMYGNLNQAFGYALPPAPRRHEIVFETASRPLNQRE